MTKKALDFFGRELAIGDEVAFTVPKYRELTLGKIISIAPQKCTVEYMDRGHRYTYMGFHNFLIKKV